MKPYTFLGYLVAGLVSIGITPNSVLAAETIYFIYPPFNFPLRVRSLEQFAEDGTVNQNLNFYLNLADATPQQKNQFQEALRTKVDVDPVLLSRFLNTEIGEDILSRFGYVVNIPGGRNAKYPLRGAVIQAALSEEGLSLLSFLRQLPVNVEIDLNKSLEIAKNIETVIKATILLSDKTAELSQQEIKEDIPVNYNQMSDLRQLGPISVTREEWNLRDPERDRQFYVDVHLPDTISRQKTPVVILSHGLASRPEDFAKYARHLASYGYLVLALQHPGSDAKQLQALIDGISGEIFLLDEFIDRPLDITYLIDELERRNDNEFNNQLILDEVGVFGHSFGGYTALAVGGAKIDFSHLRKECQSYFKTGNTSLLLQCRLLDLPEKDYDFRDPRVKAIYASNPVNSAIFGPRGLAEIQIPVFIAAGNYDPATPFVFEQALSFPWFETRNKYLMLQEGQAHVDFSELDGGLTDLIESTTNVTLPTPQILDNYVFASLTAFFSVYIQDELAYLPYLQSSYLAHLSENQPFKAYLITEKSSQSLEEAIQKFQAQNNLTP